MGTRSRKGSSGGASPAGPAAGPAGLDGSAGGVRHLGDAQRRALVAAWRKSGQNAQAFAAQQGLKASTLYGWSHQLGRPGAAGRQSQAGVRNRSGKTRRPYSAEERRAAVETYQRSGLRQRDFARVWGVALKSLSVWLSRYRSGGPKALEPGRCGRPKGAGRGSRLPAAVQAEIVRAQQRQPQSGLRRLSQWLWRFRGLEVSPTRVRTVLRERGLNRRRPSRRPKAKRAPPRRFERSRPGELWQSDITSFVLSRTGTRVYLVALVDDFSRYVVGWALSVQMRSATVIEALLEAIARYGKPREVLTDQGPQYFTWRGKSAFGKLLVREGIRHVVARSHHPQTVVLRCMPRSRARCSGLGGEALE